MCEDATELEALIQRLYQIASENNPDETPYSPETAHEFGEQATIELLKEEHAMFTFEKFGKFPSYMLSQDGGQPWFLFWLTNALEVCNQRRFRLTDDMRKRCCAYLRRCWNEEEGGFAGAPGL